MRLPTSKNILPTILRQDFLIHLIDSRCHFYGGYDRFFKVSRRPRIPSKNLSENVW